MNVAQILSVVGLICEFLVVLATAWRVFLRKGKAKEEEIEEMGKPISKRILSERDYQAWVFALLFAGFLLQIVGILLE